MKYCFEQIHMDTRVNITVYLDEAETVVRQRTDSAFKIFSDLEKQFSLFKPSSEISRINQAAGKITPATSLFLSTLKYALEIAKASNGLFDPLVGVGNYQDVIVSDETVFIPTNSFLDLNSVVKGMALDMALGTITPSFSATLPLPTIALLGTPAYLPTGQAGLGDEGGVMIEAGGDIVVHGLPPEKIFWDIGIRNPREPKKIITVVHLASGAICTSGGYFRKKNIGHHLINPKTKQSPNNILSLTVIAPTAREADALSTAAFFMPIDQGIDFVEKFPGASCLIIDNKLNIFL
jgi:thiamine biosynthesis lipoprotein